MPSNEFQAVISAVDAATANIRKIADEVKGLQANVVGVDHAEKKVGSSRGFAALSTHVDLLRGHFSGLRATIGRVGGSISNLLPMLAGLGAVGSAGGFFELANGAAEAASKLEQSAKILGMSRRQFAELAMAAKMVDVPVQQMRTGLGMLGKTIGAAAGGQNKVAAALFAHLGIALKDSHGHVLSVAQALPQLAEALRHTTDSSTRLRMATALFGRAGQQLLPMLDGGSAALAHFASIADQVDFVPTKGVQEKLESFHASWIEITAAASGFSDAVGAKLAPVLQPVADGMKNWVVANRAWIATDIAAAVKTLADAARLLVHTKVAHWLGEGASKLGEFMGTAAGAKLATIALAAAMGPLMVVSVVKGIGALADLKDSIMAIQVVMMANPLYLVAAGIAAAAVAIYEYWGPISAFFRAVWGAIKAAALPVWNWLKTEVLAGFDAAAANLKQNWGSVRSFFVGMWGGVKAAFADAWAYIAPIVDRIRGAVAWVQNSWIGRHAGLGPATSAADTVRRASVTTTSAGPGAGGTGSPLALPDLARAPLSRGGAAAPARVSGHVQTTVTFKNAPRGTQVETKASGAAAAPQVNLGFAAPAFGAL